MKVIHIIKTSVGATWSFKQIKVLKEQGVEVHVILPNNTGKLYDLFNSINIPVYICEFDIKNPIKLLNSMISFKKIVNSINPDIIHSHFVLTTYIMRIVLFNDNRPKIFQVPGPLHLEKGPYGKIDKLLSNRNDYWIATCKWTQEKYVELGIPFSRVFLSFYGTDTSSFINNGKSKSEYLHTELNLPLDNILVGLVAYMYPPKKYLGQSVGLKGHEDFIKALSIVRLKYPKVKGIIVGKEWGLEKDYENKLKKMAIDYCGDSIIFLGFRNDIPQIYQSIDLAVHPSLSENLGGAVESMLAGIPTITSNVGGFPDIVKENETGWLVKSQCPDELAEKIQYVLGNTENSQKIALNGFNLVRKELDVKKTALQVVDIYRKIISN